MSIDEIFLSIGELGRQQCIYGFLLCLLNGYAAFHMLQYPFVSFNVDFTCSSSLAVAAAQSPPQPGAGEHEHFEPATNVSNTCPGGEVRACEDLYFATVSRSSIVSEWELVCDKSAATKMTMSAFMTGVMIGAFVLGKTADAYGRKFTMTVTTIGIILFNTVSGLVSSYKLYLLTKLVVGFFQAGFILASFVLVNELVGASKRTLMGVAFQSAFALFIVVMSAVAYLLQHWRQLTLAISALGAPLLAINLVLPESPRWLLSKNRKKDAIKVMSDIARGNGEMFTDKMRLSLEDERASASEAAEVKVTEGLSDLFRTRQLAEVTIIQIYSWFVNSAAYYGLTLAAGAAGSADLYTATALSGAVEIPSYLLTYWLLGVAGRRGTLCLAMVTGGGACLAIQLTAALAPALIQSLALLGKLCLAASFAVVYIHSGEIFPTTVRNSGMGLVSVAARVGGIMAPFIVSLGEAVPHLQFTVLGVMSLAAGLLNLRLPETAGCELPDTITDLVTVLRSSRSRSPVKKKTARQKSIELESSGLLSDLDDE